MRWLTSTATRLMPVIFLAMAALVFADFWIQHGPSSGALSTYFQGLTESIHHLGWILFSAALFSWFIVFACYLYERQSLDRHNLGKWDWIMDVLDRLTNRQTLEQKLDAEPTAVFIDAHKLAEALKGKVIGQDLVCEDMAAQIRRRLALKQRGRPVGVFMLAGPPGTGKTYLAKCLSLELHRKLLHFDMTQLSTGHAATQLFGASKGYVGSDSYGKLTAGLRDTPDAIVLLDEFEKAHADVHKNFLTAWNDGFLTEVSDGRQISTTSAIFVMTTNAATDALQSLSATYANDADELRRASTNALREAGIAHEVLSRIDRIFIFKALTGLDIARVAALEIEAMIKGYGLDVSVGGIDPDVLLDLMRRQDRLGDAASSRDLVRSIEESIADSLINAKQNGHTHISLVADGTTVVAKPTA